MAKQEITPENIREAAYLMWLDEGCPEGRDQEHWLKAVDALNTPAPKAKRKAAPKKAAKKATPKSAPKTRAKKA
jgi:hypothetical protein